MAGQSDKEYYKDPNIKVDFGTALNAALGDFTWADSHKELATDPGALYAIINCFWITYICDVIP